MKNTKIKQAIAEAQTLKNMATDYAKDILAERYQGQFRKLTARKLEDDELEDEFKLDEEEDFNDTNLSDEDLETALDEMDGDVDSEDDLNLEGLDDNDELEIELDEEDELDFDTEEEPIEEEEEEFTFDELDENDELEIELDEEDELDFDLGDETEDLDEEEEIDLDSLNDDDELEIELDEEEDGLDFGDEEELEEGCETEEDDEVMEMAYNKLQESNLLNAKLLYTVKLLRNSNLSVSQKDRVIEQVNKCKNIQSVKEVYNSLNKKQKTVKRSNSARLKETVMPSTNRNRRIVETDTVISRMQQIAKIGKYK